MNKRGLFIIDGKFNLWAVAMISLGVILVGLLFSVIVINIAVWSLIF